MKILFVIVFVQSVNLVFVAWFNRVAGLRVLVLRQQLSVYKRKAGNLPPYVSQLLGSRALTEKWVNVEAHERLEREEELYSNRAAQRDFEAVSDFRGARGGSNIKEVLKGGSYFLNQGIREQSQFLVKK